MIYVISDLHGYPLSDFKRLLSEAGFGDNDFLYILGDVVDRNGDGGVGILDWLLFQPNAQLILGNHESMLLACDFVLGSVDDFCSKGDENAELFSTYIMNGGDVTLRALKKLRDEDPYKADDIFDYLRESPLYETVTAGDRDFLLVHHSQRSRTYGKL